MKLEKIVLRDCTVSVRVSECQQTQHQQHVPRRFASYSVFQNLLPPTLLNKYSFSYSYIPPNQTKILLPLPSFAFCIYYYLERIWLLLLLLLWVTHLFTPPPSPTPTSLPLLLHSPTSAVLPLVLLLSSYVPPLIYSLFLFSIRMEKKKFLIFYYQITSYYD